MNSGSIRRLILTVATGYLTIFGVRQVPYEFDNEWLVIIPALVLVYALTVWVDGKIFKQDDPEDKQSERKANTQVLNKNQSTKKGFGS